MFNVNEIIAKTDLRALVEKAGGKVEKNRCACPIHGGHDASAFSLFRKGGRDLWKCFSGDCGGGDAIDFVMKWREYDFKKACEFLGGDVHSDPVEMERLARERVERARIELEQKQNEYDAALKELQFAQKHLHYNETMGDWARHMWTTRGLDEGLQDFFTLGACNDFTVNDDYHTPTLTIPIFGEERQLLNIKHRLINPPKPNDKYRPETWGLGAFPPFLAIPQMGFDGDLIVVVEGEIKAMVTWATISGMDIQTVGVPGKSEFGKISGKLNGKNVVVIPDPGAEREAFAFAKSVQARYLPMPAKVDDYIIETGIGMDGFYNLIKQSRKA